MKSIRKLAVSLCSLCLILLVGCGNNYFPETTDNAVSVELSDSQTFYPTFERELSNSEVAGAAVAEHERKEIKNAFLSVEIGKGQEMREVYAMIVGFCGTLGGYEFSGEINNSEHFSYVETVLKLPPQRLDEFIIYVGENTRILHSRSESEDVTAEFYDLTTRLDTKRKSLESYYRLLENAEDLEAVIQLQRTIDSITEDIEATEGRLRLLADLVGMATVRLSIHLENDPNAIRREVDWGALSREDMTYLIRSGFVRVVNTISGAFQWTVIIIAVTSPLWIPIGILLFVLIRRHKSKAKQHKSHNSEDKKEDNDNG
ncbi:MAG: DUF4349 domain-containing protein [Oscillospiraceae bacterium]|nr:DUF4349 domain-containing protein [Oscillospiraceae bacterium]